MTNILDWVAEPGRAGLDGRMDGRRMDDTSFAMQVQATGLARWGWTGGRLQLRHRSQS